MPNAYLPTSSRSHSSSQTRQKALLATSHLTRLLLKRSGAPKRPLSHKGHTVWDINRDYIAAALKSALTDSGHTVRDYRTPRRTGILFKYSCPDDKVG